MKVTLIKQHAFFTADNIYNYDVQNISNDTLESIVYKNYINNEFKELDITNEADLKFTIDFIKKSNEDIETSIKQLSNIFGKYVDELKDSEIINNLFEVSKSVLDCVNKQYNNLFNTDTRNEKEDNISNLVKEYLSTYNLKDKTLKSILIDYSYWILNK